MFGEKEGANGIDRKRLGEVVVGELGWRLFGMENTGNREPQVEVVFRWREDGFDFFCCAGNSGFVWNSLVYVLEVVELGEGIEFTCNIDLKNNQTIRVHVQVFKNTLLNRPHIIPCRCNNRNFGRFEEMSRQLKTNPSTGRTNQGPRHITSTLSRTNFP